MLAVFATGAALGVDSCGGSTPSTVGRARQDSRVLGIDRGTHPHYLTGEHKGFWSWTYREAGANLVGAQAGRIL